MHRCCCCCSRRCCCCCSWRRWREEEVMRPHRWWYCCCCRRCRCCSWRRWRNGGVWRLHGCGRWLLGYRLGILAHAVPLSRCCHSAGPQRLFCLGFAAALLLRHGAGLGPDELRHVLPPAGGSPFESDSQVVPIRRVANGHLGHLLRRPLSKHCARRRGRRADHGLRHQLDPLHIDSDDGATRFVRPRVLVTLRAGV